jgi:hypothetical protein
VTLHAVSDAHRGAVLFEQALSADAATIDTGANGIASGYSLLEIWIVGRTTEAAVGSSLAITLNNDTGANYDFVAVRNLNTTVTGTNGLAQTNWLLPFFGASAQTGAATCIRISIPIYTRTDFHKVGEAVVEQVEDTAADARGQWFGLRYRSTTAVSRMTITAGSGNLLTGTSLLILSR